MTESPQTNTSQVAKNKFPRIVVFSSHPMGKETASGLLIRSLFRDWDPNRIVQIFAPFVRWGKPDYDICHDYRRLHWDGRVSRVFKSMCHSTGKTGKGTGIRSIVSCLVADWRIQKIGRRLRGMWLMRSHYARGLQRELTTLRPDVLYALIANAHQAKAVYLACSRLAVPVFLHVVDDISWRCRQSCVTDDGSRLAGEFWLRELIDYASQHAAIGPHMAQEYQQRYGGDWKWFTTLVEAGQSDPKPQCPTMQYTYRLVFAGNLAFDRWKTLVAIANVLEDLRTEGVAAEMDIYSPPSQVESYHDAFNGFQYTHLRRWVSVEQLPLIFHEADCLVHVESFRDADLIEEIRWSLSSKLSQYMMAGRCIIAIGPESLSSIQFVQENGAGVVLDTDNETVIRNSFRELLSNRERIIDFGNTGRRQAIKFFEGRVQRERIRQMMCDIVGHAGASRDVDTHTSKSDALGRQK